MCLPLFFFISGRHDSGDTDVPLDLSKGKSLKTDLVRELRTGVDSVCIAMMSELAT